MAIGTYTSIINLNVNGLNAPTKTHRLNEWIQKQHTHTHTHTHTHIYTYKKPTSELKTHIV